MHELSVAHALVETVTSAVAANDGEPGRVREVHLRVGELSGVVPDALFFCYDIATMGTALEGSALVVERVPVAGRCDMCGVDAAVNGAVRFVCPICGGPLGALSGGRELEISHVVLDDAPVAVTS